MFSHLKVHSPIFIVLVYNGVLCCSAATVRLKDLDWNIYIIQFLKAGLTETISLESLVELRTNPFNIRLLQEGWVQGRFTLAFYDADINLFIHQVRNLFYDCTVLQYFIKRKPPPRKQPYIYEVYFKNLRIKVLWFLIVRNIFKIRILVIKFSVAANRLQTTRSRNETIAPASAVKIIHMCNL